MAKVYKNLVANFSGVDEFKEVAVKTLNEIYGREVPLDVFDFSFDKEGYGYAFGYRDGEPIPAEDKVGLELSDEQKAAQDKALDDADVTGALVDGTKPEEVEVKITDAAKAHAEKNGIDVSQIVGTGANGNITKGDIDLAIKAAADAKPAPEQENANGKDGNVGTDA